MDADQVQYVMDLEALIRWLARTYGDNDPIFPFEWTDPEGNVHAMPENVRMANTWREVVRRQEYVFPPE